MKQRILGWTVIPKTLSDKIVQLYIVFIFYNLVLILASSSHLLMGKSQSNFVFEFLHENVDSVILVLGLLVAARGFYLLYLRQNEKKRAV